MEQEPILHSLTSKTQSPEKKRSEKSRENRNRLLAIRRFNAAQEGFLTAIGHTQGEEAVSQSQAALRQFADMDKRRLPVLHGNYREKQLPLMRDIGYIIGAAGFSPLDFFDISRSLSEQPDSIEKLYGLLTEGQTQEEFTAKYQQVFPPGQK